MKANFYLIMCVILFSISADAASTVELIDDPAFATGCTVKARKEDAARGEIIWGQAAKPAWTTAEWGSRSSIADPSHQIQGEWSFGYRDPFKRFIVGDKKTGAHLILGVNSRSEYDGQFCGPGDPWPHLLVSQRISEPGGHLFKKNPPDLTQIKNINFRVNIKLLKNEHIKTGKYSPSVHAAQFLFYFSIQNLNRQTGGYGDYYWFGIRLFDDRYPQTKPYINFDKDSAKKKGTGKLIYNIGTDELTKQIVADGEWTTISVELYPHIIKGLNEAWKRDALTESKKVSDYFIGGMNMGWEVSGLSDVEMAVKDLSVKAVLK